jgi:hypothetical protein
MVQSLEVQTEVLGNLRQDHFAQDWGLFALDQLMGRYGAPSQVLLSLETPTEPIGSSEYGITIVYDSLGFWIFYGGPAIYNSAKQTLRACPSLDQVSRMVLHFESPRVQDNPFHEDGPHVLPLAQVTGMSLETFRKTFGNPNSRACIEALPTGP